MPETSDNQNSSTAITVNPENVTNIQNPVNSVESNLNAISNSGNVTGNRDLENPPTYEEAIHPNAPPPSYESLFSPVSNVFGISARANLRNLQLSAPTTQYNGKLKPCWFYTFTIISFSVILTLDLILPTLMMAIGMVYRDDCPIDRCVPIFLMVAGACALFRNVFCDQPSKIYNYFITFWMISGTLTIYRIYEPIYDDPFSPAYCNKFVYLFSFWFVTVMNVITITFCIVIIVCGFSFKMFSK